MTTTIIHNDVIGTSYQHSRFDVTKAKATRKLIVKSTRTSIDEVEYNSLGSSVVADLTAVTGSAPNFTTLLGPLWNSPGGKTQTNDYEIVHPSNNSLPLQTINVQTMGDQRFLVTLQYFVVPGQQGGGAGVSETAQFRAQMYSKKSFFRSAGTEGDSKFCLVPFTQQDGDGNFTVSSLKISPEAYARTEILPEVKIQLPFALLSSPVNALLVSKVGGVNKEQVSLGGNRFEAMQVRFDGVQMDQYGTTTSQNSQTFNLKGFYEFTARGDKWMQEVCIPNQQIEGGGTSDIGYSFMNIYEGIVTEDYAAWTLADLGLA